MDKQINNLNRLSIENENNNENDNLINCNNNKKLRSSLKQPNRNPTKKKKVSFYKYIEQIEEEEEEEKENIKQKDLNLNNKIIEESNEIEIEIKEEEEEGPITTHSLLKSHPLGIKPIGNKYFDQHKQDFIPNYRERGLGLFSKFSEDLLFKMIYYWNELDLAKLASVSTMFYLLSYNEEMWKIKMIEILNNNENEKVEFNFLGSWRESFLNFKFQKYNNNNIINIDEINLFPYKLKWYYSDSLYQPWLCTTIDINQFLGKDNIDRRDNLSLNEFINEYELPNKPVIITDIVTKWLAYKKWDFNYLIKNYGEIQFQCEAIKMKLKNYFQYSKLNFDEAPYYLFDKDFSNTCKELLNDFKVPNYFSDDLFQLLEDKRPDFRWLIIGPKRSGSSFHKDPNATSAWNAVIKGKKKWILFPPEVTPPGIITDKNESEVTSPVSLMEWHIHYYHLIKQMKVKPIEAICNEGEIIFVPSGWWHLVINLEDSIALTQNFVSKSNVEKVLNFLKFKPDQVSGWKYGLCSEDENQNNNNNNNNQLTLFDAFIEKYEKLDPILVNKIKELPNNNNNNNNNSNNNNQWDNLIAQKNEGGFTFDFNFNYDNDDDDEE